MLSVVVCPRLNPDQIGTAKQSSGAEVLCRQSWDLGLSKVCASAQKQFLCGEMARREVPACSLVSVGTAETSSLVPDITGISYSLFLSLPKNFFFVFLFLHLSADGFLSYLPTSENFADYFRVSQQSDPALLRQFCDGVWYFVLACFCSFVSFAAAV